MSSITTFRTDFMGYAIEWNPLLEGKLAVATAQHFGVVGQGKQLVLDYRHGMLTKVAEIETKDGVFDCTWSESVPHHLLFGSGDGSLTLWDVRENKVLRVLKEHNAEVYGVDWNLVTKESFISGAWDNTIKLWHPDFAQSIRTFSEHTGCIYSTIWHPRNPDMFASTSGDCTVKIWDTNDRTSTHTIKAHDYEILTCDWNKYDPNQIVTGSVDKTIRAFDIRNTSEPVFTLSGHEFAVRRIKCSPHNGRTIASSSYDMSLALWDSQAENSLINK